MASIRRVIENLGPEEAFFWVDELDIHLLAKVGCQWTLKGTTIEIPTPGKNQKQYLAAALNLQTGEMIYLVGPRKPMRYSANCSPCLTVIAARRSSGSTSGLTTASSTKRRPSVAS
ncbi:MAG: hypothetical protein KIT57_11920 [Blastocatellales bacterium]|nr:hypothetical protein [Blastocatellales bacterium]